VTVVNFLDEESFLVSFSRVFQFKKECTQTLSTNSVSADTLVDTNLPMQRLKSYCSSNCAHGCPSEFRCCDMQTMMLLNVIGMTYRANSREL